MILLWLKYIKIYTAIYLKFVFSKLPSFWCIQTGGINRSLELYNDNTRYYIKFDFSFPYIIIGLINTKFAMPKLFSIFLYL